MGRFPRKPTNTPVIFDGGDSPILTWCPTNNFAVKLDFRDSLNRLMSNTVLTYAVLQGHEAARDRDHNQGRSSDLKPCDEVKAPSRAYL